ncbi:hypothetical protein CTI12_AA500900 [Artemisia annua]|uniref:Uncharacterized protein n=1 Tax=Artemisia annua TaxID=35608 RepID=A0A2U1LE39_ARTAN|nr:hypothetical protein CTI12_AA500900 [Artemisia annua]
MSYNGCVLLFLHRIVNFLIKMKKVAMDIVLGLTGSDDGLQSLDSYSRMALPALSHLLAEKKVYVERRAGSDSVRTGPYTVKGEMQFRRIRFITSNRLNCIELHMIISFK